MTQPELEAERARGILAERDLALSVQVLQEFYVQATREGRPDPLTHEQATKLVESFLRFPLAVVTRETMLAAIATRRFCDAALLADCLSAPPAAGRRT